MEPMDMSLLPPESVIPPDVRPEEAALLSEPVEVEETAGLKIEEQDDGSAIVILEEEDEAAIETEFGDNLAEVLPETVLSRLGTDTTEMVKSDKNSREQRDKQYAEGIKRTGLGNEAPGGAGFDGASRAVHPMLAKGCVDFASRAIKELYPATGPCKTQIIGESNEVKIDKADRKRQYMNWQLMTQVQENRAEFERLLSQLPLGGSQYKRWWYDPAMKRNRTETVYIDDVFLPYNQSDFYTSNRVTHRQYISRSEYEARVRSGLYRDLKLSPPAVGLNDMSKARAATDKVEGAEEDYAAYNDDGLREIYQIYLDTDIEDDPMAESVAPYILHIDAYSDRVLGLYRNWKEGDETFAKKHWMVEYNFIPWRGAYGIGLGHLIGSLSGAATGAIRAILDSAHINNFPGALKLKAGRTAGQSLQVSATEIQEIDAPPGVDDIRKLIMPFPFNGPSQVLFNMLEWLTQQAEVVVTTASEKIADGGADMPMGTALALIEHGSVNFSAIHARLHASLKKELEIVHRLDAEFLSDKEVVEDLGELVVSREDFQGPMDVIPVSDPNIFSEAQRYAQLQAVLQLKADPAFAQFFKPDRLLQRALKLLQFQGAEDIANLPKDPKRLGPLEENYAVSETEPSPIKVYPEQDDLSHLMAHLPFMVSPIFGANPLIGPQVLPVLLQHCKEHLLAFYRKHATAAAQAMLMAAKAQNVPMTDAQASAKGAAFADQAIAQALGVQVMPMLQQAQQVAQQMAPKPPADPNIALQEATKKELKTLELASQEKRDEADRQANQRAADLAAEMQRLEQLNKQTLTEFQGSLQLMRDSQKEGAAQLMAQFTAQQEKNMLILKEMFDQAKQAPAPTFVIPEHLDIGAQIRPLVEGSQATSSALAERLEAIAQGLVDDKETTRNMLQTMLAGMQQLHDVNSADRVVEMVGSDGRPRTARSYIKKDKPNAAKRTQ